MTAADALIAEGAAMLGAAGVESPRREARLLLALALARPPGDLALDAAAPVPGEAAQLYRGFLARRAMREPFAQIAGRRGFWTIDLDVTRDVLAPRPETEHLVETALRTLGPAGRAAPLSILDLGTGSGAILIALLLELKRAEGLGIDVSRSALAVARDNAARLGLGDRARFGLSSWWSHVPPGAFDLVVSNPPYIPSRDIEGLEPEVRRYEPLLALDGGPDGLAAYRAITSTIAARLAPGGRLIVEVGAGQASDVAAMCGASGLVDIAVVNDLAGIPRVVSASARSA